MASPCHRAALAAMASTSSAAAMASASSAAAMPAQIRRPRFPDGEHVRLRSRVLGTYLHADTDGAAISLSPRRASMNVAWRVHIYNDGLGNGYLLLQGAAYGLYLGSTRGIPAELGHHGIHVYQSPYDEPEFEDIMWQVLVSRDDVLLRHVDGHYLRANGKYPGWNDRPTVDDFDGRSMMMRWVVERIPARQNIPGLPYPQVEVSSRLLLLHARCPLPQIALGGTYQIQRTGFLDAQNLHWNSTAGPKFLSISFALDQLLVMFVEFALPGSSSWLLATYSVS